MKNLLVYPFVGELGHELFSWQSYLRKLSQQYKHVKVVCKKHHDFLYEDFANIIENYNHPDGEGDGHILRNSKIPIPTFSFKDDHDIVKPGNNLGTEQEFIKFGKKLQHCSYDIIVHARNTDKLGTQYRNWPLENWQKFVQHFKSLKIACIGTKDAAFYLDSTTNYLGYKLSSVAHVLASSKVCVGPSSGPIHLASLCGTSHVVWSGKNTPTIMDNRKRYKTAWNPFSTAVTVIDSEGWNPSVETVIKAVEEMLEKFKE